MSEDSVTLSLRTIWVSLLSDDEQENLSKELLKDKHLDIREDLFGKKAPHLQPIVPIKWVGKIKDDIAYLKQGAKLTIPLNPYKKESVKIDTLEQVLNNAKNKIQKWSHSLKNPFEEEKSLKRHPFTIIYLKLNKDSTGELKESSKEILNLLLVANIEEYDYEVYKKIGIMNKDDSLLNLASLKDCFLTISPKSVLLIRKKSHNNDEEREEYILANTLEATSMIAISFVGYSELLTKLAKWESKVWEILKSLETKKKNSNDIDVEKLLDDIIERIDGLIKCNYQSSSLLQFHMSYVTSSIVAQNFFKTFSEITGLDSIHHSLLTKLENCERLLNHLIDYYQFKEMERLRGMK